MSQYRLEMCSSVIKNLDLLLNVYGLSLVIPQYIVQAIGDLSLSKCVYLWAYTQGPYLDILDSTEHRFDPPRTLSISGDTLRNLWPTELTI